MRARSRISSVWFALVAALGSAVPALAAPPRNHAAPPAAPPTAREVWGPEFEAVRRPDLEPGEQPLGQRDARSWLLRWNRLAIDATGRDHSPVAPGEERIFGEQFGPGRTARALAIVQIAVFDAVHSILGRHETYSRLPPAPPGASVRAAIAQAAHDALAALYPSQAERFAAALAADLARIPAGPTRERGLQAGARAAAAILAARAHDGSHHEEPRMGSDWVTSEAPGHWRQDPIGQGELALGAHWGEVDPFVLASPTQFRAPPPPPMTSPEYTEAFEEVKRLGGDGGVTATVRTAEETEIGVFWAYDGTPSLCAPPRLYNQIAVHLAAQERLGFLPTTRLLALVNVAMADAAIAVWESKYHYDLWRPVTGIREADPGTGPTGAGDGNPATRSDPTYTPLGAPASNLAAPNFTPPFPAYPSGHAGFGGAVFQVLRRFFGTDEIAFTFVSDELNGDTEDNSGDVRPLLPRSFDSFSEAEEENGRSRIYLGIHWQFDATEGIAQGRQVGDWVFDHAFRPAGTAPID